jgi:LysM repeat protein
MRLLKIAFLFAAFAALFTILALWLFGPPPWRLDSEMLARGKERAAVFDRAAKALVAQAAPSLEQGDLPLSVTATSSTTRQTTALAVPSVEGPTAPVEHGTWTPSVLMPTNTLSAGPAQAIGTQELTPTAAQTGTTAVVPAVLTSVIPDTPSSLPTSTTAAVARTPTPIQVVMATTTPTAAEAPAPASLPTSAAPPAQPTPLPLPSDGFHTVQDGDTLATIAARYGTSVEAILSANSLSARQFIWLGQRLLVPAPGQSPGARPTGSMPGTRIVPSGVITTAAASAELSTDATGPNASVRTGNVGDSTPFIYAVRKGDYLAAIAKTYGTTVAAVAAANSITDPSHIEVGMRLVIPATGTVLTSTAPIAPSNSSGAQPAEKMGLNGTVVILTASGKDFYTIRADGSGLKRLAIGLDPALSTDGQRVVFARWGEQEGLYTINTDGTEEKLIFAIHQPRQPAWSPDGSQIAFSFQKGDVTTEKRDKDGKLYRFTDLFWRVAVVGLDGQGFTELPCKEHSSSPTWSIDGKFVAFAGDQGLTVSNPGGFYRELTHGPWHLSPTYSPDGSRIAFMMKQADHFDIFLRPVLDISSEQPSLTGNKGIELKALTSPPRYAVKPVNNVAPTWSPDGKQVAFLSDRDGSWQIYVMDADGSNQRKMFESALTGLQFAYDFASERSISWGR